MTATNKRLLISESHGDSNRCTPYRGKLDQHATYASHTGPRMPDVCFLRVVPVRGKLLRVIDGVEQAHCSREEGLPTQSTAHHWPIRGSVPSFSPEPANKAVGPKPSIYQRPATRLTGPISPLCDRYVQYLLVRANRMVLNRHRQGGATLEVSAFHVPLPNLPDQLSPLSPSGPARSPFNQVSAFKPKCWVLKNLWPPRGLLTTHPSSIAYIYA
jgi:hypothetical protein